MSSGLQVYVDMAAEALRDGTDLFGRPLPPGAGGLADQAVLIEQLAQKMAADDPQDLGLSGVTVEQWREHAQANARAVAAAAATDKQVAVHLDESGQVVADGSSAMDANNQAAQQNTAAIAPFTNTPAGTRQMLRELDNRLGTGKQVISAADQRSAQLAQLLRATRMPAGMGAGMGGGMGSGMGGGGFGGMSPAGMGGSGGGGFSFPNLTGLTGQHRGAQPAGLSGTAGSVPLSAGAQAVAAQAVNNALSKQGCPYGWGDKGPDSFDCSGLINWAYKTAAGVDVGGDTYAQYANSVPVNPADVQPGDYEFSEFGAMGNPGPGHVRFVIGPDSVVAAPQTGDVVKIQSIGRGGGFEFRRPKFLLSAA